MLQIFPFLAWLAAATSAALLVALQATGDLGARGVIVFGGWWCVAAWCQFLGRTPLLSAAGLALQAILAVCLLVLWKFRGEG